MTPTEHDNMVLSVEIPSSLVFACKVAAIALRSRLPLKVSDQIEISELWAQ